MILGLAVEVERGDPCVSTVRVSCHRGRNSSGDFNGASSGLDLSAAFPAGIDWIVFMNNDSGEGQPLVAIAVSAS